MPTVRTARLRFNFASSMDDSITKVEMGYQLDGGEPTIVTISQNGGITSFESEFPVSQIASKSLTYWSKAYSADGEKMSTMFTQTLPDFVDPVPPEPTGIDIVAVYDKEVSDDNPPVEPPPEPENPPTPPDSGEPTNPTSTARRPHRR